MAAIRLLDDTQWPDRRSTAKNTVEDLDENGHEVPLPIAPFHFGTGSIFSLNTG